MKTPRELLFGRHQSAGPELDRIRRDVVGQLGGGESSPSLRQALWRELIWPVRHAWLGLGAAWVIILALNLTTGGESAGGVRFTGPMAPDSVIALQKQEWLMAQSVENDTATPLPAKSAEQRPRSEAPVEQESV